jgi:hypothetical protein
MELSLYETVAGHLVAYEAKQSQLLGERPRHRAGVSSKKRDWDEVRSFFGQGWLAKKLYAEAGIENVRHVA